MTPDFIHNEIVSPVAVDECLKIFEKNSHRHEAGTTAAGINDKYKKSTELCLKLDELENIPTYLNELNEMLKNAGTNFVYLNWDSECKKGSTIFPTDIHT
jgi:hypothetical protein